MAAAYSSFSQYQMSNYPYHLQQAKTTLHYYPQQNAGIAAKNRHILPKSSFPNQTIVHKTVSNTRESGQIDNFMEAIDEDLLNHLCYAMGLDKLYYLPELNRINDFLDKM